MNNRNDKPSEHSVSNWAAIVGRWKFEGKRATYEGPQRPEWPFGLCVSNIRFLEGEARVTVYQPNGPVEGRILLGYQSLDADYFAVGLGGWGKAYTLTHFIPGIGWRETASTGVMENLTVGKQF